MRRRAPSPASRAARKPRCGSAHPAPRSWRGGGPASRPRERAGPARRLERRARRWRGGPLHVSAAQRGTIRKRWPLAPGPDCFRSGAHRGSAASAPSPWRCAPVPLPFRARGVTSAVVWAAAVAATSASTRPAGSAGARDITSPGTGAVASLGEPERAPSRGTRSPLDRRENRVSRRARRAVPTRSRRCTSPGPRWGRRGAR
jgi:hypothetical protein